jgi:hypothetical protein
MTDVTRILDAIRAGEPYAASDMLPLVYNELNFRDDDSPTRERTATISAS